MIVHNLPVQPTPFIGRETELADVERLLADPACRLLTFTGPGGIGKTRLAIEAARRLVDYSPEHNATERSPSGSAGPKDGVYFVPLQSLTSPDLIVLAIADALHFTFEGESSPQEQLLHLLRQQHLLLLLDNFEHLLGGVELLPQILEYAPRVKLLVTSRERLHLLEEWVLDVGGLAYPERPTDPQVDDYSAVRLFVQSARRAGYIPSGTDTASIIYICRLVEGVPLAIELAATWVRVMPCAAIAREIEGSLDILNTMTRNVPAKHHSMRAVFDHSWSLLSDEEQAAFRQLSILRGGFTREAADHIAGASLRTLASLVDKSLLRVDSSGRYDVHELLRQYALEKLTEAGESQVISDHHRDYFLTFAERAELELFGPNQLEWLNRVETELGNLGAAIEWSQEGGDVAANLRLTGSLYWFWHQHGYHREGYARLMDILSQPQAKVRTTERARALIAAGIIQGFEARYEEARPLLEEALAIAREVGGPRELTGAARTLGHVLFSLGEYKAASLLLEEGVSLARQLQDHHNLAWSLVFLGDLFLQQGEMGQAQGLYQESADLLRELHDKAVLAYAVRRLGQVMRGLEDYERASALCQESLALNITLGDRRAVAASLVALAGLALAQGNAVHAAHLLGAAERLLNDLAAHLFFPDQLEYDRHRKDVRERLDTSTLNRAWAEGQSMALEQAVAEALGHSPTPGQPRTRVAVEVPGHRLPEMLNERELEILRLLDSGLSTREVAQRLFLSVGTVRWYLNQVYSKLQVHGRAQALSRARELKLLV